MRKKLYRFVSLFTVINLVVEIFFPAVSYALTSGPSQPEHVQFAPVGANNSVDLFSGDFSYNIPLFELPGPDGGYPFNLTYQAGVGVEEEASWVGLGWNLTPGAINRQMRGLPDEFKGDSITQKIERKPNTTVSTSVGGNIALELFGYEQDKLTKLGKIFKNTPLGGVNLSAGLTLSVRDNNYTGVGYSFAPTFSYGMDIVNKNLENIGVSGISLGRTHNLTVDSESGINSGTSNSINFNFSVSKDEHDAEYREGTSGLQPKDYDLVSSNKRVGLGLTHSNQYNSRQGLLSEGYSLSASLGKSKTNHTTRKTNGQTSNSLSGNWSLDFTNNGYMPSIATPTLVVTTSFMAKVGLAPKGIYGGSFNVSGTLTSQGIKYDTRNPNLILNSAYGYNHSENAKGLMDINRERDKIIDKETKTLPTPNFMYDTYMVTGQGITGMFRPYRGEVGVLGDNYAKSITRSGAVGLDISTPVPDSHWGINLEYTGGSSKTEKLSQIGKYGFKSKQPGSLHEPLYYKFQGEASIKPITSLEKIGNHLPVRFDLNSDGSPNGNKITYSQVESDITNENSSISALATATMTNTVVTTKDAVLNPYFNQGRDSRNTLIQEVTNKQAPLLPEFNIKYEENGQEFSLPRKNIDTEGNRHLRDHHLAGFTCLNAGGSRYIYGLPAYNYEQKETVKSRKYDDQGSENEFQEDGSHLSKLDGFGSEEETMEETEKYKNETTTPAYPYAYLLTSILGTDYIDVDYNDEDGRGISENDLGYWVKFGYERVHSDYEWRSPYKGVNFTEGLRNTNVDDKASLASGKKDIFYVQKVETKSHIAIFYTSDREDGKSVTAAKLKKLDRIALFTRAEFKKEEVNAGSGKPIKEIHFDYTYELCKNTPNGGIDPEDPQDNRLGKLTLKKIWFTYQGVIRGKLSPYEFEYYNADYSSINPIISPQEVTQGSQDRWGVFAPRENSPIHKTHASFPYVDQTLTDDQRTDNVSAWNLKEIKMPTGSRMRIKYESDDYAYVQDKKTMQMYPFSVEENPFSQNDKETLPKEDLSDEKLRIYFRLQDDDVQTGLTEEEAAQVVNKYLDGREQVYVKTLIGLREDKDFEDMSAYLDIKSKIEEGVYTRGITQDGNYGYITLQPAKDTKGRLYHPITVAAWIKLKTEHPRLLLTNNEMNDNQDNPDWNQLTKMFSAFQALREVRGNYYNIAKDRNWGRKIKHKYSYVKLNNTKGHKYGGGYRVKSVEFWDGTGTPEYNSQSTYGQVYDYTTQEDGKIISSGVASYEPLLGGDENALRYAEKYIKDIPGKSKHAMGLTGYEFYVEYPVNEGYYPGAKVGYSKVTVKSLATANKIAQINEFKDVSTTGLTINEFYTTKDFPTLAAQTDIDHQEEKHTTLSIFPFFAKTKQSAGMSQGFVVEVNNMDGKPKAMYHYGQNDKGEVLYDKPISSSQYFYKTNQRGKQQVLDNACDVLVEEKNGIIKKEKRLVGVEYDVFIDSRKATTKTTRAGGNFNTNIIVELAGIPIPTLFFSSSGSEETVNITTINKIIYRSGILDYVKVSDGLSTSTTQNLLWDANTGGVLLTSVNNNFDDKIYSYTIPAYTQYDEMGAAYRNVGLKFELEAREADGGRMYNLEAPIPSSTDPVKMKKLLWTDELVPGDELIIDNKEGKMAKAIYMGADRKTQRFQFFVIHETPSIFTGNIDCTIMRSGRRNLLAASAGNITSLKDPTETGNRTQKTFSGKSTITKEK